MPDTSSSDNTYTTFRGFVHEIRNPMSAVLTAATLLRDPADLSDEDKINLLDVVDGETRRMNDILSAFDHYLKVRNSAQNMAKDSFDLIALVRNILAGFSKNNAAKNVQVIDELPASQLIDGDENQVGEAVRIILQNTLESLRNSTSNILHIYLKMETTPSKVLLRIGDNGEGFSAESLRRAFEPFYSTRPGACGLGLPLARCIMQNHGGDLEISLCHSAPGACLSMIFPR